MLYVTGIHALNIPCSLDTCGDWHQSGIQWEKPHMKESFGSLFGDYGIETDKEIPDHTEKYAVANHIRALLDLIEEGNFPVAQGMRDDFIGNDKYTPEVFDLVAKMRNLPTWDKIDDFMGHEYFGRWLDYKEAHGL